MLHDVDLKIVVFTWGDDGHNTQPDPPKRHYLVRASSASSSKMQITSAYDRENDRPIHSREHGEKETDEMVA
jgi:hypothetical protein